MTRAECFEIAAEVSARWPHAPLSKSTVAIWWGDLQHLPADQVRAAVIVHDREGNSFPPTCGQIVNRIVELAYDHPGWDEVWAEVQRAIRRVGSYGSPSDVDWSSPLVGAFVRRIGWVELCRTPAGDTSAHAQCREVWKAMVARVERDSRHMGIAAAGLKQIERAAVRQPGLKQFSPGEVLGLPLGEEDAA